MTLAPRFVFLRSSRNGYIAERHSPWVAGVRCAGSVLLSRSAASTPRCVRAEKLKTLNEMTEKLNSICNPEKTDKLAKADQKKKMDFWGGKEKVMAEGSLVITPPPGIEAEIVNSNN